MKFNAVKFFIITSLIIIILYVVGLFLPIIINTKDSKIQNYFQIFVVFNEDKENYFSLRRGNNSTKLQGL